MLTITSLFYTWILLGELMTIDEYGLGVAHDSLLATGFQRDFHPALHTVVDLLLLKATTCPLIHGLNQHYRKNELEEKMLLNLHKKKWTDGLTLQHFDSHSKTNEQTVQEMLNLAIKDNKAVQEEDELPPEKLVKKHLEEHVSNLMSSNIVQTLGMMLDTVVFKSCRIGPSGFSSVKWRQVNLLQITIAVSEFFSNHMKADVFFGRAKKVEKVKLSTY
ncbi:hypothetical protein RJT34_13901 [Clitoria ternatea]|uniref:26S proteasome regulatory subunit RPN11 C-terminal domain-containing protein n=1 Tax=Clitoria ternatea TaxID=43366 RepID=A0AAN9PMN7_CLITE